MNKFLRSIFKILNFFPCFKCFSFDLNNTPLDKILLLVFKRVLMLIFKRVYQFEIISQIIYQFEKYFFKTKLKN
jgi:hypothetical protein